MDYVLRLLVAIARGTGRGVVEGDALVAGARPTAEHVDVPPVGVVEVEEEGIS